MARVRLTDKSLRRAAPASGQVELWDDLVPGFGLRIAAGGSRTFFVMKRLNGKLVRRTVGRVPAGLEPVTSKGELKLAAARDKARLMLAELHQGVDPDAGKSKGKVKAPSPADAPTTFGQVAAAYFKDPAKRGGARLASRSELERKVKVDLKDWEARPISEIGKTDIKALLAAKRKQAPVAANRLLSLIKRIFRYAAIEDLIPANPAVDIEGTDEDERDRVLTVTEITRVWSGADALGYPYGPLIKLLILTAQRKAEVAGLPWAEIDGTVWRLPDQRTKRRKGHLVPLSPLVLTILNDVPRIGSPPTLVFTTGRRAAKKGEKVDREAPPAPVSGWSRLKTRLDRIIAEAAAKAADEPLDMEKHGLPAWTLHDIRRSVATHLRDETVMGDDRADRLTVSKILNHAEGGMTRIYDRYASDPEKRRSLEAWANRIERNCGLNVVSMEGERA
jgi:integrase